MKKNLKIYELESELTHHRNKISALTKEFTAKLKVKEDIIAVNNQEILERTECESKAKQQVADLLEQLQVSKQTPHERNPVDPTENERKISDLEIEVEVLNQDRDKMDTLVADQLVTISDLRLSKLVARQQVTQLQEQLMVHKQTTDICCHY